MIKLITASNELDILPADAFTARITALFDTYGFGNSFAMFWIQDNGNAAISRVDGCVTLYAGENADFEELSEFLGVIGYSDLTCSSENAAKLGLDESDSSFIVEYKSTDSVTKDGILNDYDKKQVYALLCGCGFSMGDYGSFLADVCARLNKNTALMAAVADSDGLCACAFALFKGRKSTLLGAVGTAKEKRGRGLASKLVKSLAQNSSGKVFLFCRDDGLSEFYKKCGFEICGRWSIVSQEGK